MALDPRVASFPLYGYLTLHFALVCFPIRGSVVGSPPPDLERSANPLRNSATLFSFSATRLLPTGCTSSFSLPTSLLLFPW